MRAICYREGGDASELYFCERPMPVPGPQEIRIWVYATALNRADILQRRGKYPPPPGASPILGLEVAGVVDAVGEQVRRWRRGDRVMALLDGGGYATYAIAHEGLAMPIPERLSFEEAAAIPEAFLTAYQALFWLAQFETNTYVLIHAGASGVGTAAIQLVTLHGGKPIVTAGSAEKIAFCKSLGAVAGFNYREGPFAPGVAKVTGNQGVRVVIDFVGAPYWEQNLQVLAPDGYIVLLATLGGAKIQTCDLRKLFQKWAHVAASTLRNRPLDYKVKLVHAFERDVLPFFEAGKLRPVIYRVVSWQEVSKAHQWMEHNQNIGKIVLRVDG